MRRPVIKDVWSDWETGKLGDSDLGDPWQIIGWNTTFYLCDHIQMVCLLEFYVLATNI